MKKTLVALALTLTLLLSVFAPVALAEEPLKLTGMAALYSAAPAKDSDFWKLVEEKFNVDYDVEWVTAGDINQKIALVAQTGELPDIVNPTSVTDTLILNAINEGYFYDLTDLLPDYPNLMNISQNAWNNSSVNGRNYCIPRSRGQYNCCMFVRGDILAEMGVSCPVTLTEYENYFRYCKENYNMIPLTVPMDQIDEFFMGVFGNGSRNPVYTEDGNGVVYYQLTESYAKYVEWLKKLYDEGLFGSEFALYTQDTNSDLFLTGQTAMRYQNIWHKYRLETSLQAVAGYENSYLTLATYATSDDGANKSLNYDPGYYGGLMLNADLSEEKVRAILSFLNETSDPANYNLFRYGIEGVHWTMVDGLPNATQKGKDEITNSNYGPFILSTATYDKVISALADSAYNNAVIAELKGYDDCASSIEGIPLRIFQVISSDTWAENWGYYKTEFAAYVAATITGEHTIDELRAYQADLAKQDWAQEAFVEFKSSLDQHKLVESFAK